MSAAVIMGRIRSALRAYALEFPGPADVLVKLDQKMQYPGDDIALLVLRWMREEALGLHAARCEAESRADLVAARL